MALYRCYKAGLYGRLVATGNFQGFDDIVAIAHADKLATKGHWRDTRRG
jgi:hypothetical protein